MNEEALKKLRAPFPDNQISLLPKPTKRDAPKGRCNECGGWHGLPAVHLSYVGHAALTDRLLDADPAWTWEPLAMSPEGLPVLDPYGGMWIKLTVAGVTRLGYGHAGEKSGGDAIKEIIGDALRNAAMRFGAALDLWHKGELHAHEESRTAPAEPEMGEAYGVSDVGQSTPHRKPNGILQGPGAIPATVGAMDMIDEEAQTYVRLLGSVIPKMTTTEACDRLEREALDNDTKVALWSLLDSKTRSAIKKEQAARREMATYSPNGAQQ